MKKILLDKKWRFTYKPRLETDSSRIPVMPEDNQFDAEISVPAIWDDCIEVFDKFRADGKQIDTNPLHVPTEIKFGKIPDEARESILQPSDDMSPFLRELKGSMMSDGTLPNIVGVGWYKQTVNVPCDSSVNQFAHLKIGGVLLETWVFVNRKFVQYKLGHSTPFSIDISNLLKSGKNEIVICIANNRLDRIGTSIRGYKGQSGGIYRSVSLELSDEVVINDAYFYADKDMERIYASVEIVGELKGCDLNWKVMDGNRCIKDGKLPALPVSKWNFSSEGLERWSEYTPKLYLVKLIIAKDGRQLYELKQSFGLRRLVAEGTKLKLNGKKVFLRGVTEHCYWPITTTVPTDKQFCYKILNRIKNLGFNWIRCHTWTPPHEYLDAADELGLMIQVEVPAGFGEDEWRDILLSSRRHPSVVIYCGGNEEVLDERMIEFLKKMSKIKEQIVPDALFNPQGYPVLAQCESFGPR